MSNSQQQQHGEDRGSSSEEQQPELQVWVRAANLIAALSSTWEPEAAAAGAGQAAAEAAAASSAASLMLHIFPHWSSNKVQQQQQQQQQQQLSLPPPAPQQQQQQQQIAGSSGSGSGVGLLRRWRSGGAAAAAGSTAEGGGGSRGAGSSSSSSTRISPAAAGSAMAASSYGALALVSVTCSAFAAALQRLSCIDHAATETALSNAAARAAAAAASAAAEERRRARLGQPSSRDNAADGRTAALQALPCVMHVIGHGESLASIAAICGVSIPDILAANPDLPAADIMPIVQASDCIALPVPAIPPCLHVVQHGDTLHGIARMYRVPLGRLIAKNPELADPSRVQQGWVVVLPGLKGDSKSGAAMEWLAEAAVAAAAPEPDSSDAAGPEAAPAAVVGAAEGSSGTQPRDVEPQQHIRQDQAVASEPAAAAAAAAGFSLQEDDTAPSGLDSSGSSPIASWAHVGWRKPAAAPAAAAGAADVAAASLLPAVGSGAFMFAVGQASESCAECIPAGNHVQLRMSAVQQHHSHPGKSGRASSWPGSRSTAAAAAAGHSLLRAP
jgi:LysM repeat protein